MEKLELLAPAGDLERLKIAIDYGADAVYFAGESFGLRAAAKNFTLDDIKEGMAYVHSRGKKAYMTLNILAHNEDLEGLPEYLESLKDMNIDAFIVSDPGVMELIKEKLPGAEIHLSTQASTTNYRSADFWHRNGAKRIVLARELSLAEIKEVREKTPKSLEIETFVQGAMCISYSGRCLLSNVLTERDANRGACAHPCRWNYFLMEEKRPGEYFPVFEDERGTYVFNSKDLCMIEHIPALYDAGVRSLKIEGRMKTIFYVATVVGAYRKAIDAFERDKEGFVFDQAWLGELNTLSNRSFTTGFYFNKPTNEEQNYGNTTYNRDYTFVGIVESYDEATGIATIQQRNKLVEGETIEVFGPFTDAFEQKVEGMTDENEEPIEAAPHPQQIIHLKMARPVEKNFMLRRAAQNN